MRENINLSGFFEIDWSDGHREKVRNFNLRTIIDLKKKRRGEGFRE
jgi:hypothetical protein